jgi:4-hydroxy-4-methyl-2-oxoglutarate aldolase
MDAGIRPLHRDSRRLIGLALTVKAPPGDNLTVHGALSMVQNQDVLVVDWRGSDACGSGAGSLVLPILGGLNGVVVDGGWRDVEELQAMDFPIYGRTISPFSPPKKRLGEINVPVSCGGVIVTPGDVVVADHEGVVIVPREHAQLVADSLRDYRPRHAVSEWDLHELRRIAVRRREWFDATFQAHGGIVAAHQSRVDSED